MIEPGTRIGNYTVVRQLGAGGMGEVYLAQHLRLAKQAAIKVLRPALCTNPESVERFFNEARATSLLRHPGIVEVIDCDVFEGRAFIVMEHLEGESLGACLERAGSFDQALPAAYNIARQVAAAVGSAHERGIIHRDLKPDNVFLGVDTTGTRSHTAKVLDFGVAKLLEPLAGAAGNTQTGSLLGTPLYMSPEQCRGTGEIDQRSDIYALGCILFEMVSGRPPFVRRGAGELVAAHLMQAPPPLSSLLPEVPPALEALVDRMLAKAPDERPATMADVASLLTEVEAGAGRALSSTAQLPRLAAQALAAPVPQPVDPAGDGVGATRMLQRPFTEERRPPSTLGRAAREIEAPKRGGRRATLLVVVGGAVAAAVLVVALRWDSPARAPSIEPPPAPPPIEPREPPPAPALPPPAEVPEEPVAKPAVRPQPPPSGGRKRRRSPSVPKPMPATPAPPAPEPYKPLKPIDTLEKR